MFVRDVAGYGEVLNVDRDNIDGSEYDIIGVGDSTKVNMLSSLLVADRHLSYCCWVMKCTTTKYKSSAASILQVQTHADVEGGDHITTRKLHVFLPLSISSLISSTQLLPQTVSILTQERLQSCGELRSFPLHLLQQSSFGE